MPHILLKLQQLCTSAMTSHDVLGYSSFAAMIGTPIFKHTFRTTVCSFSVQIFDIDCRLRKFNEFA